MSKLFDEFKKPEIEIWINQLKKDLKDKSIDVLQSNPERNLQFKSYYHPQQDSFKQTAQTSANKSNHTTNQWRIRESYPINSNNEILDDLNNGIDSVGLKFESNKQFEKDSANILFEHIQADIQIKDLQESSYNFPPQAILNFDVIQKLVTTGNEKFTLTDFIKFYTSNSNKQKVWISGSVYGNAGCSSVNELAFILSHTYEYINCLSENGISLDEINKSIVIEISLTHDYFVNISKVRALRELISFLFSEINPAHNYSDILIFGSTSTIFQSYNDSNNNYLRQTTQAMSGIIGGCDTITVNYLSQNISKNQLERNKRIARNIQLLLKEESYFDKVVDPSSGSMAIENITQELIQNAWNKFCSIEDQNGLIAYFKSGNLLREIENDYNFLIDSIRENKLSFLGISTYLNNLENRIDVEAIKLPLDVEFTPILPVSIESAILNHNQKA